MNKAGGEIIGGRLSGLFVVDKTEFAKDLMFMGSWNAYCLVKSLV